MLSSFFSVVACSETQKPVVQMTNSQCKNTIEKQEWINRTFKQAKGELGDPTTVETFSMNDAVITEFRGKLEMLFPQSTPEYSSIWIKEASWKEGDCILTLWFKKQGDKWNVVDTLYWHKDTEF
jgi:hypothetical protein